jgi:hypothetical protein
LARERLRQKRLKKKRQLKKLRGQLDDEDEGDGMVVTLGGQNSE